MVALIRVLPLLVLLSLTSIQSFSQSTFCIDGGNLSDSLKLFYPFTGNANDLSGYGNNGALFGSPSLTSDRYGNPNSAYSFSGSSYIRAFQTYDYQYRTISMWFSSSSIPSSNYRAVFQQDNYTNLTYGSSGIAVLANSNLSMTAAGPYITTSYGTSSNTWYNVVLIRDGSVTKYYVNGELISTGTSSALGNASGVTDFILGIHRDLSSYGFQGKIDDVRVYNRALNENEVEALYCPAQVSIQQNDTTIDVGTSLSLANFCNNYLHTWSVNGVQVSTADTLSQLFSTSGNYQIILSSTDGFCTDYDTLHVFVNEPVCIESGNLTDSLILLLPLDGSVIDYSGNQTASLISGTNLAADRFGNANSALNFDGNHYIEMQQSYDLPSRTFSVWFRSTNTSGSGSNAKIFLDQDASTLTYGSLKAWYRTGTLRLIAANNSEVSDLANEAAINTWNHVALVRDGSVARHYLNGKLLAETTSGSGGSTISPNENLVIGAGRALTNQFFVGDIDDVRAYNRALTPEEIAALYCPAQVNIQQNDTTVESGTSLSFNNFCNNYPHTWSVNGTQVSTSDSLSYLFDSVGVQQIVLSSTDGFCIDYDTLYVDVSPNSCLTNSNLNSCLIFNAPLGGVLRDLGPNNLNMVSSSTISYSTDRYGNSNGALNFNGTNDEIILNNNNPIITGSTFSVSLWAKVNDNGGGPNNQNFFFQQRASTTSNPNMISMMYNTNVNSNTTYFANSTAVTSQQTVSTPAAGYGGWHHYTMVMSSNTLYGYRDGQLFSSTPMPSGGTYNMVNYVTLGTHTYLGTVQGFLNGDMDEFKVFDCALTNEEVQALYCPAQVNIVQNDTVIEPGTLLTFNNFCNNFPHTWTLNGTQVSTADTLIQTFSNVGMYEIVLSSTDGFCVDYDTVMVRILPEPTCLGFVDTTFKISNLSGGFLAGLNAADNFGSALESIPDSDNDGLDELFVGAYADDDGGADRGAIYYIKLTDSGTVDSYQKISTLSGGFGIGLDDGDKFGSSIADLGDVNGDGFGDIAVGAYSDDDGGQNRGAVWILFLDSSKNVMSKQKLSDLTGGLNATLTNGGLFGCSIETIGDLDNNGVNDILVGEMNGGIGNNGSVFLLYLSSSGTIINEVELSALNNQQNFGKSIASLGDIDANGTLEIAVGADLILGTGAVVILSIDSAGTIAGSTIISEGQGGVSGGSINTSQFGRSVECLGDIDGDGYTELAVGVSNDNSLSVLGSGIVHIFSIDSFGYVFNDVRIDVDQSIGGLSLEVNDFFGSSLAFINDINQDGFPDLFAGALGDDDGGNSAGAIYMIPLRDTCCPLVASFTGDNNVCEGNALTFTNTSQFASSAASYAWYVNDTFVGSSGNLTYIFNQAGNVLVKLVANDSCERSFIKQITVHPAAVANAGSSTFICLGDSVQLSASGGISYQWSNPTLLSNDTISNPFAFPTATTIYSVTVTDTNGCVDSDNMALIVNPIPVFDVSGDSLICLGDSTTLVADNAALTYNWSPASSLSSSVGSNLFAFPSQTTTYIVEGTDANTCSDTVHYTVSIDTSLVASVLSVSDALCYGSAEGTAVGSAVGGTAPYTFAWPNGTMNDSVSGLTAGSYTFTVSDIKGCADSAVAVIGEPDSISVAFSETPVVCFGESNGALNASPSGGTGPYTFAWSNGANTQNISGLTQGIYTLTITDANLCSNIFSTQVTEPTLLQASITSFANVSCFGGNDGAASVLASGGTLGYTYSWSNGSNTVNAINLTAGDYFVTSTDANFCSRVDSITISEPTTAVSSLTSVINDVSCFGFADGSAQVIGVDGTPSYSYLWSNGSDSAVAVGLSAGTNYSVTTTDILGCAFVNTINVAQPTQLSIALSSVQNITCNGSSDGVYQVQASQATAPYVYSWSTGSSNDTIFGADPGFKSVTVTDANACQVIDSILITEPSMRNDSIAVTQQVDCFGNATAEVSYFAQGGYGQYTYNWSNGVSGSNLVTGLATGWYTATVTDSGSCAVIDSIFVDQPTLLISTTQLVQDVSCFSGNDGAASAQGIDGTLPYSYAWSNGDADSLAENLSSGKYFVTITDANNCTTTDSISISEPTLLTVTTTLDSNVTCFGYANGIATATPAGGTNPYSYVWENGEITQQADSLLAGTRNVTVTDALGCTVTSSIVISEPTAVLATLDSTKDVLCNGFYDGLAFTSASGGTGPHSFSWNTGDTIDDIDSLTSGTYILTVYDSIGCFDTTAVTIIELTPVVPNINWSNVSCFDGNNGTATTAATGGGTMYSYTWNTGDTTTFLNTLVADTFIVHVTDEYSCNTYDTAFVTQPDSIEFSFDIGDISCAGFQDGSLKVDATGGTSTLTFAWSTGSSDSLISTLDSGYYSVTATDINGCSNFDSAYIFEPSPLVVSTQLLDSVDCFGNANGDVLAIASGGVGLYEFAWSNGDTIDSLIDVSSATYTVTLTDSNNCTISTNIFVNEPNVLNIALDSLKNARCKDELNGYLSVASTGGNLGYQYLWNTNDTAAFIDSLSDGNYTVTVADARGCVDTLSLDISEPDSLLSSISYTDTLVCKYDGDGLLTSFAIGGTLPYAFAWENGPNTDTYSALSDGTYRVTITDVQGCQDSSEFVINALSHLTSQVDSVYDILCFQDMSGFIQASAASGTTPYVWNWNSGNTTDSAFALSGGNYYYTVTDSFACVDSGNAFVFEPTELLLSIDSVFEVLCFGDDDGQIYTTTQGGIAPYDYAWSNGDLTDDINALDSGMYVLTVTDDNGCQITDSALIMEPAAPLSVAFTVTDANCLGGATGNIVANPAGGSAPYEFLWSTADTTAATDTLFAGWYFLTITDDHGCVLVDSAEVFEPLTPDTAIISRTNVSCFGFENGVLTANFVNGISPFNYGWNTGDLTQTISSLDTGNYDVTIIDSIGCTQVAFDTITEPDTLISSIMEIDSILCFGDSTAALEISTIGGTLPYNWTWNTGDTSTQISNLPIGTYSFTLTDALGCVDSALVIVSEPSKLIIDSLFVGMPSCYGFSDAKAFVSVSGGTPNYSYAWTSGETIDTAFALNAGNHSVTVVDAYGCSVDSSFIVDQPDSLIATLSISQNPNCDNTSDGILVLDVIGGRSAYQMMWSTGEFDSLGLDSLAFGNYDVIVKDAFGCVDSAEIFLPYDHENPNVDLGEDQIFCDGFNVPLSVSESLADITWSTGSKSAFILIDETDVYSVDVVDSNGCIDSDTIYIEKKFETAFDFGNDTVLCTDLMQFQLELSVDGFSNYDWSTGSTESSIVVNSNDFYSLVATNEFGCVSMDSISVSFDECLNPVVFPVPTFDELTIQWPKVLDQELTFTVINMQGQVVYSKIMEGALEHTLQLHQLSGSAYYLLITGDNFGVEFRIVKL